MLAVMRKRVGVWDEPAGAESARINIRSGANAEDLKNSSCIPKNQLPTYLTLRLLVKFTENRPQPIILIF